jgi:hypothetical protein
VAKRSRVVDWGESTVGGGVIGQTVEERNKNRRPPSHEAQEDLIQPGSGLVSFPSGGGSRERRTGLEWTVQDGA